MSSTSDTNHISAADVADETVDHTSTQKLEEKTTERIVPHEGKEQTITDDLNGIVEGQANGLSKDEPVNGVVGIPFKTEEPETSSLSVSVDKTTDESINDIPTNPIPPFTSHDEQPKQEEAEKDIIQLDEHPKDWSEGQSEDLQQEIPIFVSGETKAEDPDDVKYDSAVEVEPVQKAEKPDGSASSTANEVSETPLPAPEKENNSDQTIDTPPTALEPAPTEKPQGANQESQSIAHGSASESTDAPSADLPSVSEPKSEQDITPEAETHTHEEHPKEELVAHEEQAKDEPSTHTDPVTGHEAESVPENVAPPDSHDVESSISEPNSANSETNHESTTVQELNDIKLEENAPEAESTAVSSDANPEPITTATSVTEIASSEPSHEPSSTDISTSENQSTTVPVEPEGPQTAEELAISQNPTTELSQESALVSEEQPEKSLSTTGHEVEENTVEPVVEQTVESHPAGDVSEVEKQVDESPVEQAPTQIPLPTESVTEPGVVDTTVDETPAEVKASHEDAEGREEPASPTEVTKAEEETPFAENQEVASEVDQETQTQITSEAESPAAVEVPATSEQPSHTETEEVKVEASVGKASGEEDILGSIEKEDEEKQDETDTPVVHDSTVDSDNAEAKVPHTEASAQPAVEMETKPNSEETPVEAVGETSGLSSSIAQEVEDGKVELEISPLVQSSAEETVVTSQSEEGTKDSLEAVEEPTHQVAEGIPETQSESKAETQPEEQPETQSDIIEAPTKQEEHAHADEALRDENETNKESSDQGSLNAHEVSLAPVSVEVDSGSEDRAEDGEHATAVGSEGLNEEVKEESTTVSGASAIEEEKSTLEIHDESPQAIKEEIEENIAPEPAVEPVPETAQPPALEETASETPRREIPHTEEASTLTTLEAASDSGAQGPQIVKDITPVLVDEPVVAETASTREPVTEAPVIENQMAESEAVQEPTAVAEEQITESSLNLENTNDSEPEPEETTSAGVNTLAVDEIPHHSLTVDKPDVEEVSPVEPDVEEVSPVKRDVEEVSLVEPDVEEVSPVEPDVEEVSPVKPDVEEVSLVEPDVEEVSPVEPDVEEVSLVEPDVEEVSPVEPDVEEVSPVKPDVEEVSPVKRDVEEVSLVEPDVEEVSPVEPDVEEVSLVEPDVEEVSPVEPDVEEVSPVEPDVEEVSPVKPDVEEVSPVEPDVEEVSPVQPEEAVVITDPVTETRELGEVKVPEVSETLDLKEDQSELPSEVAQPASELDTKSINETTKVEEAAPAVEPSMAEDPSVEHTITTTELRPEPVASPPDNEEASAPLTKEVHPVIEEPKTEVLSPVVEEEKDTPSTIGDDAAHEPPVQQAAAADEPSAPTAVEEVSTPIIEVSKDQSPIEEAINVEEPTIKESKPEGGSHAVEEDKISTPVTEEGAVKEPPVQQATVVEESVPEAFTPATATPGDVEEVSIPVIEEITSVQPPVEHAAVVEEPVTESVNPVAETNSPVEEVSTLVIEEVSQEQSPVEDATAVEEPVTESVTPVVEASIPVFEEVSKEQSPIEHPATVEEPATPSEVTPTPVQEVSIPVIEEVSKEQPLIEHPATVEEPDTSSGALVEETSVPAIPEISEQAPAEHPAASEEPVAEVVTPGVQDEEQVVKPVTEKVSEELDSVEPAPVVEEPKIEVASEEEPSTSSVEAATKETAVEQAADIEEPVAKSEAPIDEEHEKTQTPVIEDVPTGQQSEEKVTSVEEPGTEVASPTVEETVTTAPPVVEESSVEQAAVAEEPTSETVTLVAQAHEEVATPIIEAAEHTTNVEKSVTTEDISTNVVNDETKEHVSPVEEPMVPIVDDRTETIQEPVTEAAEVSSSAVVENLPAIVESLEHAKGEPETHLPPTTSNDNAEESSLVAGAISEGRQVDPTSVVEGAPDTKENTFTEEETSIPKAETAESNIALNTDVAKGEPETSAANAVEELQPSLHEPETTTTVIEEAKPQSPPAEAASVEHVDEVSDSGPGIGEEQREETETEPTKELSAETPEIDHVAISTPEEFQSTAPVTDPINEEHTSPAVTTTDKAELSSEIHELSDVTQKSSIFGGETHSYNSLGQAEIETPSEVNPIPETEGTIISETPTEEPTSEEQSKFDSELAAAEALLNHPISGFSANEVIPQKPFGTEEVAEETPKEVSDIPTLVVTTTGETQPSHGDDFGPDATTSQKDAYELHKVDTEPDQVITVHETEESEASTLEEAQKAAALATAEDADQVPTDDEYEHISHADAIPDEQEPSTKEEPVNPDEALQSTTPIPVASETASAVADSAAILDPTDRSTVSTPIAVASETAAAVQDTALTLDPADRSYAVTPIPVAAETAAAVEDSAATLEPVDRSTVPTPIPVAAETAAAVEDTAATLDPTDRSSVVTPIPVAAETAAAVEDTAATLDPTDRSSVVTPIPVAAETAAAVEDTAATLDPTDRSSVVTPIPVAAETASAVEDTAATLDPTDRSSVATPIPIAAETAAVVEDSAATLDPTDRSVAPTPIPVAAETAAAVEDSAAILDVDVDRSNAPTPIAEIAETAAAVEDTAAIVDPAERSLVSTPIPQAAESAAEVEDTAQTLDIDSDLPESVIATTATSESLLENADPVNNAEIVPGVAAHSFRESSRPSTSPQETGNEVVDNTPAVDTQAVPTEVIITPPSPVVETPSPVEVEKADSAQTSEELNTGSAIQASGLPTESITNTPDDVAPAVTDASSSEIEVVESAPKAPLVPQVVIEEEAKENSQLGDNLVLAGAGLAGAALIGGGIYAATRDDKVESVPMARTITNESSKSIHDKPLAFKGDHFLPHMKEVGPQVAETEVHRAEIVRPNSTLLSKSVDAPHDNELLGKEDRKDTDPALKDQLTDNPALSKPHTTEAIPEPEPAHGSKGKERAPDPLSKSVEEDDLVDILEASGHLQAPNMQRDPSGSSEFNESLISVDAISEALRYMRENSSDAAIRPPDIVVSEETTDGDHKTRNIVEVITPDTELATESEVRRRDPSTRREQSRPSTRGSDMVSAKHHKNLMENFWKLVFVGWLGGFGKFFVGLFGRKNGEQLGSVYANYAAMRESQQLMSQQNVNFEQHRSMGGKGKEKEKERATEEGNAIKNGVNGNGIHGNGVNGNGVSGGTNGVSNGSSNEASAKVKEGRRGSIKKKWNAYRKKAN